MMRPHTNITQLIMLMGGAMLLVCLLILIIYLLQKAFGRGSKDDASMREKVPLDDESAFTLATVKGVITQLKAQHKEAQDELTVAARQAEQSGRKFTVLAGEFDHGLLVFDAEGYISFSNPAVRKMLAIDTWSRRRFGEIFQEIPPLRELLGSCFEARVEARKKMVEWQPAEGSVRRVEVTVLPSFDRSGMMDFVVCVFRDLAPTL